MCCGIPREVEIVLVTPLGGWASHSLSSMLKVGLIYKVIVEERLEGDERVFQITRRRAFPVIRNRLCKVYEAGA